MIEFFRILFKNEILTLIWPINWGKVNDEHPSGDKAIAVNGAWNVALSLQIAISNKGIIVNEIPRPFLKKVLIGMFHSIGLF